jgi:tetratricopeptide (TPR) repeat protein
LLPGWAASSCHRCRPGLVGGAREANDQAIAWWRKAGEAAFAVGAYTQAAVFFRRAIELIRKLPPSDIAKRAELECCLALKLPVAQLTNRRSDEVREILSRALQLSEEVGASEQIIEALYGLYMRAFNSAELVDALQLASRLSQIAEEKGSRYDRLLAIRALGTCLFSMGRFDEAIVHLQDAAAEVLQGSHNHRPRVIEQAELVSATYLGWALLITGQSARGARTLDIVQSYADVVSSDLVMKLATYTNLALAHFSAGDQALVESYAASALEALRQVDRSGFFVGIANVFDQTVRPSRAEIWLSETTTRDFLLSQHIELGAYLEAPTLCAAAALMLVRRGNPAAGASLLGEALEAARATDERWYEAELLRLQAGAALKAKSIDEDQAAQLLGQAGQIARSQNATLFELRSAIDLARLRGHQHGGEENYKLLSKLVGQFPGDIRLPELEDARMLMDEELSAH